MCPGKELHDASAPRAAATASATSAADPWAMRASGWRLAGLTVSNSDSEGTKEPSMKWPKRRW